MKTKLLVLFLLFLFSPGIAQDLSGLRVLLYTKNGKGYVHDNIPQAIRCFDSLARKHRFQLKATEDPGVFTAEELTKTDLVVFASTNNEVFETNAQRLAFRQYIEAGGLFLGIHSVLGTERNWTWFKQFLGGTFAWHPRFQPFEVLNIRPDHPSVKAIPVKWVRKDECYFMKELYPGPEVLLVADLQSLKLDSAETVRFELNKGGFARYYPSVWQHRFDGGLAWITALGHDKSDYSNPEFVGHLTQAMGYMKKQRRKLDFSRAYAKTHDEPLLFTNH
ncbi:MAG TPA: ThuA domain-containing protein [Saprospiraceae bacterium]|nr:ThuA domain-containing protein [Saprospiraceae bacterium]HNT18844.1 ThuA domain-containing protein [Saprospiraceae bacterium]